MSRKNETNVAIAVHPKLNIGDRLWHVDFDVEHIELLSRPYYVPYLSLNGGSWWIDYKVIDSKFEDVKREALGDVGVKGFSYDNRPCRFVWDHNNIQSRSEEVHDWFKSCALENEYLYADVY